MKVMSLRDARAHLSAVIEEANTERILITNNGRPAAVVIGVRGQDTEEVMLVSNPKFWQMVEESRLSDRTLTAAEVRARIARQQESEVSSSASPPKKTRRRKKR